MRRFIVVVSCIVSLVLISAGQAATVQYGVGSVGQPLFLDTYSATLPGSRAVILIHGGGWSGGDRANSANVKVCGKLRARGVSCFSPDYELSPTPWPTQLQNLTDAVNWLRANAVLYNANGSDISPWGFSAGAHLALMLAYRVSGLKAVVAWSAPTDLTAGWDVGRVTKLLGCDPDVCSSKAKDASPLFAATSTVPPTLLAHSVSDSVVPYWMSQRLDTRLSELGVSHRFDSYPGASHGGALNADAFDPSFSWWQTIARRAA